MTSRKSGDGELGVVLPFPSIRSGRETGGEWVFAAIPLPMKIASAPGVEPIGLFFVDVASGWVFVGEVAGDSLETSVTAAWRAFSADLVEKGRPLPDRVRTQDDTIAAALRGAAGDEVEVTSGPTPEIAELEVSLAGLGGGVSASYFHGQALDTVLIREFFAAAAAFRRAKPWQVLGSGEPLVFNVPRLGVEDAGLCIISDGGEGGLQIIRSIGALFDLYEADQNNSVELDAAQAAIARGSRTVMFYRRRERPHGRRRELPRLSFAPRSGPLPALVVCDPMGNTQKLTELDYRVARVALESATRFITDNRSALDDDEIPYDAEYRIRSKDQEVEVIVGLGDVPELDDECSLGGIEGEGEQPTARSVHRLKVKLVGAKPPIWRRLDVPSLTTLGELHEAIQAAMGWWDEHLHHFSHCGRVIAPVEDERGVYDEDETELWAVLPTAGETMRYTYDYGDEWVLELAVEDVRLSGVEEPRPRCVDGRRAGPPENCGGVPGLQRILERGSSRLGDEEPEFDYDPKLFSVESVNVMLGWTADEASAEIEAARVRTPTGSDKTTTKGRADAEPSAAADPASSKQRGLFDGS